MKVSLLPQQLDSISRLRKDKGTVSGFKKYMYLLSLWIVSECTRSLYDAESHFCTSFILRRKAPASQLPCWEGVNEHGRCVPPNPPNWEKGRDAFVTLCFLLSHQDSNLTELPQEGLRMYLVFDQASSDGGRHYFCFHVTFFFPKKLYFLLLFQLPDLKKSTEWDFNMHF